MDVFNIIQTPRFNIELLNNCYYIYDKLQNPIAARNLFYKVKKRLSLLQYFPEMYPKLDIHKDKNMRKMIIGSYVIIYKVDIFYRTSLYLTYFLW